MEVDFSIQVCESVYNTVLFYINFYVIIRLYFYSNLKNSHYGIMEIIRRCGLSERGNSVFKVMEDSAFIFN